MSEDSPHISHTADADAEDTRRALFMMRAGGRLFAVESVEVEATSEGLLPAPLPFAPPAVLGIVALRGRMRTAIAPLRLSQSGDRPPPSNAPLRPTTDDEHAPDDAPHGPARPRFFIALRGDEQLALACEAVEATIEVAPAELRPAPADAPHARAIFEHGGSRVTLLDTARLFDVAMRGTERRRKRS